MHMGAQGRIWLGTGLVVILDHIIVAFVRAHYPYDLSVQASEWFKPFSEMASFSILLLLAVIILSTAKKASWIGKSLLLGGFASNQMTLFIYGGYIDYLPLGHITTNIADLCICIGAAMLVWDLIGKKVSS